MPTAQQLKRLQKQFQGGDIKYCELTFVGISKLFKEYRDEAETLGYRLIGEPSLEIESSPGYYDSYATSLHIICYREETDSEYKIRIKAIEQQEEMIKANKVKDKEKEYATYLRLKAKFDKEKPA